MDIIHAIKNNDVARVKELLDSGSLNNSEEKYAVFTALLYTNIEIVKLLLEHPNIDVSIKVGDNKDTALHIASRNNDIKLAEWLLAHPNIDVNSQNINGFTPLHLACRLKHIEIIKLLLNHPSIDLLIKDRDGYTSLENAFGFNNYEIVELFLKSNYIDVNAKYGDFKKSFLHMACNNKGYTLLVKLLLAHPKIDVNSKTHNGWTPLHLACSNNHIEIVKLLLARPDIDVNSINNSGYTPLHIVCNFKYIEIVKLLLSHPKIKVDINYDMYSDDPMFRNLLKLNSIQYKSIRKLMDEIED